MLFYRAAGEEDIMPGLIPKRRSREEIERADELLLRKHKEYLQEWMKREQRLFSHKGERERSGLRQGQKGIRKSRD
jgi:hypothetical protein